MKIAAISEVKARLAKYLRMVKSGEQVEIQERGVPVAILTSVHEATGAQITPPTSDARHLSKMRFSVKPKRSFDVVDLLLADRRDS